MKFVLSLCVTLLGATLCTVPAADAPFTGQIRATLTRGGEVQTFLTAAGTNCLRLERGETNRPYAKNLIDRTTGQVTLLFPHNRSYVVLPVKAADNPAQPPGMPPGMAAMPPMSAPPSPAGIGPDAVPAHVGPTNLPGMSEMPGLPTRPAMPQLPALGGGMPMLPPMAMMEEKPNLVATDETTNLLGLACRKYELKQRGEIMEIWAAPTNLPFAAWLPNQPPRFGPRMLEEQWGKLVADKKLFPLLAILKFEPGSERLRYEVKSITPQKPEDQSPNLFQPPPGYHQLEPLPF